ncbi:MAG: very short patch repair endonuclease [Coriobacteriia bacterium]|nr:very short patch repair endonuclease [Coriobacteriia bacterium]
MVSIPPPTNENTSRSMRGNRGKDTSLELALRSALREAGLSGYRIHWKTPAGRPDIAYPGKRIAIYVNGCWWHRCAVCKPRMPKSHAEYWNGKFERNIARDREKQSQLENLGWVVLVVWECQVRDDLPSCVQTIRMAIAESERHLREPRPRAEVDTQPRRCVRTPAKQSRPAQV